MKTEEKQNAMSNKDTEAMEAENIAHLTGRMDAIIEMMEFGVMQIKGNDYLAEMLMVQINQAKLVNGMIFEMHKKK